MNNVSYKLLIKHAVIAALELTGVVTFTARTVNGDTIPMMSVDVEAQVLHIESAGYWTQIDLRDAVYTVESVSDRMDVITLTVPMFKVRLTVMSN